VTENFWNCDGKFQFVTEIVTESTPSQFHSSQLSLWRVRHNLWRKYSVKKIFVTEIVTDFFRHKKICDGNCDGKSVTISSGGIAPGEVFCDELGDVRHKIVTESVTFRHNLWRRIANSLQFVTENWDGFPSHFSFCDRIPSQFPSENVKGNQKRPPFGAFQRTQNVNNDNWKERRLQRYYNKPNSYHLQ